MEDVILTLGNVRGSLGWLAADAATPDRHRAGLHRIEHQLKLLDQRARDLCRNLPNQYPPPADAPPAVSAGSSAITLERLLRDALGAGQGGEELEAKSGMAMFRTARRP